MRAISASDMASGIISKTGLNSGHRGATSEILIVLGVLFALLVTGCGQPKDQPVVPQDEGTTAQEVAKFEPVQTAFSITVSPADDGLEATWRLTEAASSFAFSADTVSHRHRRDDWSLSDGWVFEDGEIRREDGAPFDSFSVTIGPATRFYDRSYVPLARIGEEGWLLHFGVFGVGDQEYEVRFEGFSGNTVSAQETDVGDLSSRTGMGNKSLIYLGPESLVEIGARPFIASPDVPDWLRDAVIEQYELAHDSYDQLFGRSPGTSSMLVFVEVPGNALKEYKGEVSGPTVALYFKGYESDRPDRYLLKQVGHLLYHEVFHLWNAGEYKSAETDQPWLHEGTADYFADRLLKTNEEILRAANRAQVDCLLSLAGESLLTSKAARGGNTPYQCGYWVNFLAEHALHAESGETIFELWRDVFEANGDRTYSSETFISAIENKVSSEAFQPIAAILDGSSYRGLGPILKSRPIGDDYGKALASNMLFKLLEGYCSGSYGFWTESDGFLLDTDDRCGEQLANNPKITHLNGISMLDRPADAYRKARSLCRTGASFEFSSWKEAALWPIACPKTVANLPDLYEITEMPHLPPLLGR